MNKRKANPNSGCEERELKVQRTDTDNRVIANKSLKSLQEMAAIQTAVALWHHRGIRAETKRRGCISMDPDWRKIEQSAYSSSPTHYYIPSLPYRLSNLSFNNSAKLLCMVKREVTDSLEKLPTAAAIRKMIEKYISPIQKQFTKWMKYHHKRVFITHPERSVLEYLDEIVWRSDGVINYIETANKLLASPRLTEIEKFRVMCTYCLKNEIETVSPYLFGKTVSFRAHPLIWYWQCYVKGILEEISSECDSESIIGALITKEGVDNRYAIIYFLNALSEEEKVDKIMWLIREHGLKYQALLLNELTEVQQHHVFMAMAPVVVKNYAEKAVWTQAALQTWLQVRNYATESQFFEIVEGLIALVTRRLLLVTGML